jgi:thioredoxin-like negative regulator of GroEL
MKEIHLFVQEGCRPCTYAETQLKKVEGWENVVTITNAKENGAWSEFAKQCGVEATPTLVALIDGNIVAKMAGSKDMTSTFWRTTIGNHSK